jgi:multidrug efflux pump
MNNIIKSLIHNYKSTLLVFILIFVTGVSSYISIPKESQPNIEIPYIWVDVYLDGISPEDSEKLIVRPLENELKNIKNVVYVEGEAGEGYGWVFLEFEAGTDTSVAIADVRDAVNIAKSELPKSAEEPVIGEYSSAAERPVLEFMLYGDVSERVLSGIADKMEQEIKSLPEILKVDISGQRKEMIDITILPEKMALYDINQGEIFTLFNNNDQLIPAGSIENKKGIISFKIPGAVDTLEEILNMPIKIDGDIVLTFQDIAEIKRIYKDPTSFARVNGEKTIAISIKKRTGKNILDAVNGTKDVISEMQKLLPEGVKVKYTYDGSEQVEDLLEDLENNIISSVLLVALVILVSLGLRTSILVAFAIPGAFLMGIIALSLMGISLNMVVLFALIMSIGMLVDGAIVVSEYADKKMQDGLDKSEAYKEAASRMSMPIISSTATTLAAFIPLLFWPSTTGQFMMYLPLTLIVTLTSSIFMALVFIPTLGSKFGKKYENKEEAGNLVSLHKGEYDKIKGMEGIYYPFLKYSVKNPISVICGVVLFSAFIMVSYVQSNEGTIFFPESNSDSMNVLVKSDGDFSIYEKDIMVKEIETKLIQKFDKEVETFYTRTKHGDNLGRIKLSFVDWQDRPTSSAIADLIRAEFKDISGLQVEVSENKEGPSSGKDLEISLGANSRTLLFDTVTKLRTEFKKLDYLIEIEDDMPSSGLQWNFEIDRAKAARFGTSLSEIGASLQMITNGLKISEYRPDDVEDEIDIRVRYPEEARNIQTLQTLTVNTNKGQVPLSTFVKQTFSPKINSIFRMDGMEDITLNANLVKGVKLSDKIKELKLILEEVVQQNPNIRVNFEGDQEEQDSTMTFLTNAFGIAIFIMFMILVAQFNSYYQTIVVLSAIVFSTMGVFGLLYIIGQPFGIVMGGIGIISLAGIVINNNIVLIDTFNEKMKIHNGDHHKAIIETGIERLRPVFLTTITTILGLFPMALKLNIDVITGNIVHDAPSSQFWYQLAYSIMGGMGFAFFITLLVTPALLVVFKDLDLKKISGKLKVKSKI